MDWDKTRKPWRVNDYFKLAFLLTKDDIEQGVQDNCQECPIARAVRRTMPEADTVTVGAQTVTLERGGYSYYFALCPTTERSASAVEFIRDFDRGSITGNRMNPKTILKRWAGCHFSLPYLYSR